MYVISVQSALARQSPLLLSFLPSEHYNTIISINYNTYKGLSSREQVCPLYFPRLRQHIPPRQPEKFRQPLPNVPASRAMCSVRLNLTNVTIDHPIPHSTCLMRLSPKHLFELHSRCHEALSCRLFVEGTYPPTHRPRIEVRW